MIPEPSANVHLEKDHTYLPEVWTWFSAGIIIIALRWFVRTRTVSFAGLKPDDYMTLLFTALWTINAVIVQITYYTGGNVDVLPAQALTLSDHDISVLAYGSKWEFTSWYTYSGSIWVLKFQVLCFYHRLNLDLITSRSVKIIFVVTGLAYVALLLTISLSCRPYHYNWQIKPLPGAECTFRPQNFWTLVVLNVLTDVAILSIPTPLLFRLRISWPRKVGVSILLLSGLFMIATAIVRAVQTLTNAPSVINVNRWGFRETGVGMIAVNAATLLPLFTKRFWRRGGYASHRTHGVGGPHFNEPPQPGERNRRPSGNPLAMKWNAAMLLTRSVISNSGSRTTSSITGGVTFTVADTGSGGGSTNRGRLRSGAELAADDTSVRPGDRDLELGVFLEAVGEHEEPADQARDTEKAGGFPVEITRIGSNPSIEMLRSKQDQVGPSDPGGNVGDISLRTSPS